MIVLGIVGAPAGGKSTVARYLQELGATWVNADLVAREVLEREAISAELIGNFGQEITNDQGKIDRTRLAERVFGDDVKSREALNYLESVVHPPTRQEITQRLHDSQVRGVPVAVLDVPLLFESKWDQSCDEIWCVDSPWAHRLQRAKARGWDEAQLRKRESNQLSIQEKRRLSHRVVMNDSTLQDLASQVRQYWFELVSTKS